MSRNNNSGNRFGTPQKVSELNSGGEYWPKGKNERLGPVEAPLVRRTLVWSALAEARILDALSRMPEAGQWHPNPAAVHYGTPAVNEALYGGGQPYDPHQQGGSHDNTEQSLANQNALAAQAHDVMTAGTEWSSENMHAELDALTSADDLSRAAEQQAYSGAVLDQRLAELNRQGSEGMF